MKLRPAAALAATLVAVLAPAVIGTSSTAAPADPASAPSASVAGAVAAAAAGQGESAASAAPDGGIPPGHEWVCLAMEKVPELEVTLPLPTTAVDQLLQHTQSYRGPCAEYGEGAELGEGALTAYSQVVGDRPVSIGMVMSDATLDGLPHDPPSEGRYCFDKDGDGSIDPMTECAGGYERQLDLGAQFLNTIDTPFSYVLSNWNPHGHGPPDVYDRPHFDVHFYTGTDAERLAIRPGPCPALVDCEDYELAKLLPEERYLAPGYADIDAIEPAMGNHLVDPTGPEFNGEPFTHSWVYGSWNGAITFYETMVAHDVLAGLRGGAGEDACYEIPQPAAWQESGWYPTSYCLRHRDNRGEVTVSMEDFVYRAAG